MVALKRYFDRTKTDSAEKALDSIARTAHALDLGIASVNRIMAEYNRDPSSIEVDQFQRGHPPLILTGSLQALTRDYVRAANYQGKHITIEMLSQYLTGNNKETDFSTRTLGRALDRWGFTYGKGPRSQHLKEKDHVIAARRRYLREMRANRNGNKLSCLCT